MATKGLKAIAPVPTSTDFLDIVLSKTQRKTPTVIHKNFKISRIRNFYMRKVKFTQDSFDEKLEAILTEFPILDDLHPFMSSLMNVLYDKNHYKLALGQLRTAKHLIDQVGKDYVRLLKFGDSMYRCKQLKKAALGRMATIMKRQKDALAYLEQVRQHLSRLPAIDPNTRTLLVCGYPNVGKSSFMNKVTRADVDVQPYAFTTKSLFVGHLDYKYLRWQVIDTPGILDHPLEEMNTIEMQSITALAHLRSCIMYFMDLSEQCGYTIEAQCKLFHSIKPLFAGKPTFVVINKIDVTRLEDVSSENQTRIEEIVVQENVKLIQMSCHSEEGVMDLKNQACDALLAHRVEHKVNTSKVNNVLNRIHVAQPKPRDELIRAPFIPESVQSRRPYDKADPTRIRLEKDIEADQGGPGVFSVDMKKNYLLAESDWKYDVIPEIWEGKNVSDFIDVDIMEKLEKLEREEEKLEAEGFYESDGQLEDDTEDEREAADFRIATKHKSLAQANKKGLRNKAKLPRTAGTKTLSEMSQKLTEAGLDPSRIEERARVLARARSSNRKSGIDVDTDEGSGDEMDVDGAEHIINAKSKAEVKRDKKPKIDRRLAGLRNSEQITKAVKLRNLSQRERNRLAKAGEADRHIGVKMPKLLYTGKRGVGKTNRR